MDRLIVVGGGVLGAMHALLGRDRGYDVVHLEREPAARGASVRNFGLVWVSGRAPGAELDLALAARELWGRIGARVPAVGFRDHGSLTVALDDAECVALQAAANLPDAERRGFMLLDEERVRDLNPAVAGKIHGGLWCMKDAIVEPGRAAAAIVAYLQQSEHYQWLPNHQVTDVRDGGVRDDRGVWHDGDLVVVCPGAAHSGPFAPWLSTGVRRVRLQMMETERFPRSLTTSIADADSLRYYPAYADVDLSGLDSQPPVAAVAKAQLLMVQRPDGALTIGDTHDVDEPFPVGVDEAPYEHLRSRAEAVLGVELPPTRRRWAGVYSQTTDGTRYARHDVADRVVLVTGLGGRGMTCSPAIAEETFG
jgi:FAD dependent oxidoreductase TIGR03364